MTKPQQQAHTPGPLWSVEPRGNLKARQFIEAGAFRIAEFITRDQTHNARQAVAAVNSYSKHCGPRAVECAEADLLGEALAALQRVLRAFEADSERAPQLDVRTCWETNSQAVAQARAVLLKAAP